MQENNKQKKKELANALAIAVKELRLSTKKSVYAFTNEVDITKATILRAEKAVLDPQLSTFCRIANAFNLKPSELMSMVESELPEGWNFIDDAPLHSEK